MGKLVYVLLDGTTRDVLLDRERLTIGRRPDNDLCLPRPAVSAAHAVVVTILADSFLEDLGSTNGTLVNGVSVNKHFLRDHDEIDIAGEILVYLADDGATLEPPYRERADAAGTRASAESGTLVIPAPLARSGAAAPERSRVGPHGASGVSAAPIATDGARRSLGADASAAGASAAETPIDPIAEQPPPEPSARVAGPAIKVLTGVNAGRILPLDKTETLIGRAGVQIAALRRVGGEVHLVPVEGPRPPAVNGKPVAAGGQPVGAGDIIEISGARLELLNPVDVAGGA